MDFIDPERGTVRCRKCGAVFNMNPISNEKLKDSITVVNDAIQQIRALADIEDDEGLIRTLGQIGFNVQEITSLYERIIDFYGKGKKKKNKHKQGGNEPIGFFGSKSFMGDMRKK